MYLKKQIKTPAKSNYQLLNELWAQMLHNQYQPHGMISYQRLRSDIIRLRKFKSWWFRFTHNLDVQILDVQFCYHSIERKIFIEQIFKEAFTDFTKKFVTQMTAPRPPADDAPEEKKQANEPNEKNL